MNHIYRLVWNASQRALVAVAESTRGRGKNGGKSKQVTTLLASVLLASGSTIALAIDATTLPTGAQVTAGAAAISTVGHTLTVQQATQRAAVNWQSFSIGSAASVNFQQPSSSAVILNRVVGHERSVINGALNANGQVWILNANGLLFGRDASINVGSLVASTHNISDADFMAGRNTLESNGSRGSVINLGTINAAEGGYVALLGQQVANEGVITARLGTVTLAAGEKLTLSFNGNSLLGVIVDQGTLNALVENKNAIRADGGLVVLTAKGLDEVMSTVVNNTGEVRAQTVANKEGKIYLLGGMANDRIEAGGTLDASAPNGGNGGFIETSAAKVALRDGRHVTTAAAQGNTGTWLIDPNDYTIAATGGDITGAQLGIDLASNNVIITSVNGANASGNGDIFVNDAVTWSSSNALTLRAVRNININESITATGASAKLALEYGQGAGSASNAANYRIASGKAINLQAGQNFDTKLGSDGSNVNWTVINQLGSAGDESFANANNSLQGLGHSAKLAGNYVLGANIDASPTSTWNSGLGFTPIGDNTVAFTGRFDGLGHTIDGLTMDYSAVGTGLNVGLFGKVSGSRLSNINFTNVSIAGSLNGVDDNWNRITGTGTLAGSAVNTLISNVTLSGAASSNVLNSRAAYNLGGLVGLYTVDTPSASAGISDVSVNAVIHAGISGRGNQVNSTGGIVGSSLGNTEFYSINNASFNGTFVDTNGGMDDVGGIIGYATLTDIFNGHVVVGFQNVGNYASRIGGLVGQNSYSQGATSQQAGNVRHSRIENSSVSGAVKGAEYVGGLVGQAQYLDISGSHSTATVTYQYDSDYFGGLVGRLGHGSITDSYATGNVTGGDEVVGGLVGELYNGTITRSYATGHVSTNDNDSTPNLGGLIGYAHSGVVVTDSYATGNVMPKSGYASSEVGGLIGNLRTSSNRFTQISNSYATGQVGSASDPFLDKVGGLIGRVENTNGTYGVSIANSRYTGSGVYGRDKVGGLVGAVDRADSGSNQITEISLSYSTAPVSGRHYVGGLLGQVFNTQISKSYASGNVSGANQIGGFAGELATGYRDGRDITGIDPAYTNIKSSVTDSYAQGIVTATGNNAGGFAGSVLYADVTNVYASGAVSAVTNAGGLIGTNVFDEPVGELFGYEYGNGPQVACSTIAANSCYYTSWTQTGTTSTTATNTVANSFWDTQTSGQNTSAGGTGKTTTEMKTISTFSSWGTGIVTDTSLTDVYPKLRWATTGLAAGASVWVIGPTYVPYTLGTASGTYVYNGSPYNLSNIWDASSVFGNTYSSWVLGTDYTFQYGGNTVTGFTNAATHSNISVNVLRNGFAAANSGNTSGVITITPKTVSLSATKPYDGGTSFSGNQLNISGLIGNETLGYSGATANSKNVGSGNFISAITLANGTNGGLASNYQLPTLNTTNAPATITPDATRDNVVANAASNSSPTTQGSQSETTNNGATSPVDVLLPLAFVMRTQAPVGALTSATMFANVINAPRVVTTQFGGSTPLSILSAPSGHEPTAAVTLSQARTMMNSGGDSGGNRDVRVPVSRNSLAEIVNGGVNLPGGVEQELFVVQQ